MSRTRTLFHGTHHIYLCFVILMGLSVASFAQGDYYVDSSAPDNFGAGTLASPWKTVDFALNGHPTPLPNGSTIHLLGSTVPYGYLSREVFPWQLYGGINLVAEPGGSGTDHIVDGNGAGTLIEVQPTDTFSACTIRGLTLRNGGNGITIAPNFGVSQGLTIEECTFLGLTYDAIQINAAVGSSVTPIVRNNAFSGTGGFVFSNGLRCTVQGCSANARFENNAFSDCAGLYLTGTPSSGQTLVSGNTLSNTYAGMSFESFNGPVEVTHNHMINSTMSFGSCAAWDATSRVELNDFSGAGVNVLGSSNVVISANTISGAGTGISTLDDSATTLQHNTITGCSYSGISVQGTGAAILNNVISGIPNSFSFALSINAGNATVIGNDIRDNAGVGILDSVCAGTLYSHNRITHNGGIGIQLVAAPTAIPPSIIGDTIADNGGAGMTTTLSHTSPPYVTNCVLWNNGGAGCDILGFGSTQLNYCDIQKCGSPGSTFTNINTDPLFVDAANGNYHLQPGSPCIDTGDPTSPLDCDGSIADMGAFSSANCGGTGTPYCFGDASTPTACPCGNAGLAGHGCNNSSNTGGAILSASGVASLAADTLHFTSSGEKPTATSIFLQGTTSLANGAIFGQGIRCANGTLKRLFVHNAVGGVAVAPTGADLSVHARSAALGDTILPSTNRFYQTYYRDPTVLGGCSIDSTFNVSQALSVTWTP